jgi:hypothetical protein
MELSWLVAVLACPVIMGGMMLWMRREMRRDRAASKRRDEPN